MSRINKIDKVIDFIDYITKDMEKKDLLLLYKINNIRKEKLEIISDFVYSLNELIITTYLGDDVTIGEDRVKHYTWCWDNVIKSFKKEGIYFIDCDELKKYFHSFYELSFYFENKDDKIINKLSQFWEGLLNYDNTKTMSEYETLLDLYKIFNKSFMVN